MSQGYENLWKITWRRHKAHLIVSWCILIPLVLIVTGIL